MKFRIREKKSRVEKFKDRAERARALYFSLVVSLASIIMSCFCLLGTTYALFTSTANTDNNSLGTGFLSVSLHDIEIETTETASKANIKNEFISGVSIVEEISEISTSNTLTRLVYVMNNSTIDAEYSLSFSIDSTETSNNEDEEINASVAELVDVSYRKIDLDDESYMIPNNYVYLGKLSDLLLTGDDVVDQSKKKAMGVLSKTKTEESDLEENADIQNPFGQLYEITFSLNTTSDSSGDLSELPINIILNSTQKDLDIYQVSVKTELYQSNGVDLDKDADDNPYYIPCTYFTGCGDYYTGDYTEKPINITIPTSYSISKEGSDSPTEYVPFAYSLEGTEFIDDEISEINLTNIDSDIEILVKYKIKVAETE